ncbi:MAG: tryptophan--tRNA ligase [Peptostreptococcaceae bacterium]|nr:tryptophan--tRNA ligase [Peptostreptococcaceae bacterium]
MKRVFSGVQPTSELHLGNYLGAIRRFVELQDEMDCVYSIVDLHSITVPQEPAALKENSLKLAALFMAVGLDPNRIILFLQSQVRAHSELAWLLQCVTYTGELNRMTQFKEKSQGKETVSVGLYTYPALMAADILLYDTNYVPVGNDQKQHLEFTRNIAERFNTRFGETFVVPEPLIANISEGARIMALDDPEKKMSKSNSNPYSKINLLDTPSKIKKSIMKAVTDSDSEVRYDWEEKKGISNLMTIHSVMSGQSIKEIEKTYANAGYGTFKKDLVEIIADSLSPIQKQYEEIRKSGEVEKAMKSGAEKAAFIADGVVERAKKKMGFVL